MASGNIKGMLPAGCLEESTLLDTDMVYSICNVGIADGGQRNVEAMEYRSAC